MKQKTKEKRNVELTIKKAVEWYKKGGELKEVALQAYTEEELCNVKPCSWEEYFMKHYHYSPNVVSDESVYAYFKVMKLYKEWIGEWVPDFTGKKDRCYTLMLHRNKDGELFHTFINVHYGITYNLTFPTYDMMCEFFDTFKQLLDVAYPMLELNHGKFGDF